MQRAILTVVACLSVCLSAVCPSVWYTSYIVSKRLKILSNFFLGLIKKYADV